MHQAHRPGVGVHQGNGCAICHVDAKQNTRSAENETVHARRCIGKTSLCIAFDDANPVAMNLLHRGHRLPWKTKILAGLNVSRTKRGKCDASIGAQGAVERGLPANEGVPQARHGKERVEGLYQSTKGVAIRRAGTLSESGTEGRR